MKRSLFFVVSILAASAAGWFAGRDYQKLVSSQEFGVELTSKPLGPETVGFKPLTELPVLKQIEFTVNGEKRKFVVGEIKRFEVKRYGVKSDLVLDYKDTAVAEIIRRQ